MNASQSRIIVESSGAQASPIIVAIGANLPGADGQPALATCNAAATALETLPGLRLCAISRWYETAPIPPGGPPYINGAARLEGDADPAELLRWLQAIEQRFGRVRSTQNAPRTLDLDIIAMGDLVRDAPDPILPHPRCHLRAFVLRPLAEMAPDWIHPRLHKTAASLLADLPEQGIHPV